MISGIENVDEIIIQTSSGKWYPVKAIQALDIINDLAVLEVDYKSKHYFSLDHSLDSVKEVSAVGFPNGKWKHVYGQVVAIDQKNGNQQIIFQKAFGSGASGSPVFKGNKLIAVLKQTVDMDITMASATTVDFLRQLLSKPPLNCQNRSCIEDEIKREKQLAKEGNPQAQLSLGSRYFQYYVEESSSPAFFAFAMKGYLEEAFKLLTEVAEKGDIPIAQFQLSSMYRARAEQIWRQWMFDLFEYYKKSFHYWLKKTAETHPIAQYKLYTMLDKERNPKIAFKLLTNAAEQGHPRAQLELAKTYNKGLIGVEQNPDLALYWAKSAAKQNPPGAKILLSTIKFKHNLDSLSNSCRALFQPKKAVQK